MKKIATITFHASYNYGSNLQAYALQEYIKKMIPNCDYKIINLRTDIQRQIYKNCFEVNDLRNNIKKILLWNQKKNLNLKNKYFEEFIQNKLNITKEYKTLQELKEENFDYDYYIAGSDQLWNLNAMDFDWANYLEFVKSGKRISYAASYGPRGQNWNSEEKNRVKENLLKFDNISVRENGSFNNVKELTGIEPEINVDPTMLLTKQEWNNLIGNRKKIDKEYILLYNLKNDKNIAKIAKKISKKLKLPIITTNFNKSNLFMGFEKQLDVGPIEFLDLIKNAKLVLSSSFHGTIFSILLNIPFFAINGSKDFRISTLLEKMGLEDRSIDIENCEEKCKIVYDINFKKSEKLLNDEREKSRKYLMKALEIEE